MIGMKYNKIYYSERHNGYLICFADKEKFED